MSSSEDELTVLLHEFKADLNQYLQGLASSRVRSLKDVIAFNQKHKAKELKYFGQDWKSASPVTLSTDWHWGHSWRRPGSAALRACSSRTPSHGPAETPC